MPMKDMATASSASGLMFLRTVGGAKLAGITNISSLALGDSAAALNASVRKIHLIPDVTLRNAVLHALDRYYMDDVHASLWGGFDPDVALARIPRTEAIELEASSMKDVEDGTEMTHTNSIAVVGWSDKDRVTLQV
ncbi:hypothetical protein PAXINDRAFT_11133 [Paxillus involutus ATCC 200175]|nr:hypothetical protein PAXINDRAFT_11133 [Paxillus involutus ATCC 200175]